MDSRRIVYSFYDGQVAITLGALYRYFISPPFDCYLVAASASPSADDAGLTIDLNGADSALNAFLTPDTRATPSTWLSTAVGGANAPVRIPANTICSLDANAAAADTSVDLKLILEY